MNLKTIFSIFVVLALAACSKSSSGDSGGSGGGGGTGSLDCSTVPKSFSANVQPITSTRCAIAGCHGAGSNNGPGELLTYQEIFNARALIRPAISTGLMPLGSSLSQSQINTIVCWIDGGAPNN